MPNYNFEKLFGGRLQTKYVCALYENIEWMLTGLQPSIECHKIFYEFYFVFSLFTHFIVRFSLFTNSLPHRFSLQFIDIIQFLFAFLFSRLILSLWYSNVDEENAEWKPPYARAIRCIQYTGKGQPQSASLSAKTHVHVETPHFFLDRLTLVTFEIPHSSK